MNKLTIKAFAKLNLYLDITGKRPDGYHELKTVMQTIDLYDLLEFTLSEGSGIEILCDKEGVPTDKNNLIHDGIMSVISYAYFQPGCKITVRLTKNIPSQAGMGGGSADCAASIVAMNELFRLGMSCEEMRECAKMCGADVPFLIEGGTALCEGIGEKITPLQPVRDMYIAVVKPSDAISTPQAYKLFDSAGKENVGNYSDFEKALDSGISAIGKSLYNAFTPCCRLDSVNSAIEKLNTCGAFGAEMTGSGSAVFGIYDSEEKARIAVESTALPFGGVYRPVNCGHIITEE